MWYTSTMEVYVGQQPEGPFAKENAAKSTIESLCRHLTGSNQNHLAKNLKSKGLTLVGTIRKNKCELPN